MKISQLILLGVMLSVSATVSAAVVTSPVTYQADGLTFKGYTAYDDSIKGKRPGVIVVHEWWGHNEYARKRARMLAELGYSAIALDMYGDGQQASHPKDAGKFASAVKSNMDGAEKRFMAAYKLLQNMPQTDKDQIGAIGYCFGGGIVLAMARRGVDLKGVASFHGSLGEGAPAAKGKVKAELLVMNGADDPFVKPEQIEAFKTEMDNAGVKYEFISYPGAKHAFTNPDADKFGQQFGIPLAYNKAADEQSWAKMQTFFSQIFK